MFSTLRNRFGIPGVISVIALVFALVGGAFAANNGGGSDNGATASAKKAVKGPRGPRGPKGATGAAGPAGPQGPAGANGKDGANGTNGSNGATGLTGPAGPKGAAGAPGATGPEGSPWTAGGVLPPGETETGTWGDAVYNIKEIAGTPKQLLVPISFPIPLPAALEEVYFLSQEEVEEEAGTGGCTGTIAQPTAPPGVLCVYTTEGGEGANVNVKSKPSFFNEAQPSGTVMRFSITEEPALFFMKGTWAVTAPSP